MQIVHLKCDINLWINNVTLGLGLLTPPSPVSRGVRYIDDKLSKADKSVFLKLSATYRYRKMEILKLSKNYRYRKMHQIWSDKYMKSQSIRQLISGLN